MVKMETGRSHGPQEKQASSGLRTHYHPWHLQLGSSLALPMVIVAHSLGGTLAKQLFITSSASRNSSPEAHNFHSYIKGMMFFGTVQQGGATSEVQALVKLVNWIPLLRAQQQALSTFLANIPMVNDDFKLLGGEQIPTVCFYETRPVVLGAWQVRSMGDQFSTAD